VLRTGLPGRPLAGQIAIDVVLGALGTDMAGMAVEARAAYVAAVAASLVRVGRVPEAAQLADREGLALLQRVADRAPAATQSACYAVFAEVFLLCGRCSEGAVFARIAEDYADDADDASRFRALAVSGAAHALNGEFDQALRQMDAASSTDAGRRWTESSWPWVLAASVIAHRQGDAASIEAALASLATAGSKDVVARAVVKVCHLWLEGAREDFRELIVRARSVVHGVDRAVCPPFFVDLAASMECLALIQLGDPAAALRTIEGRRSPAGHSVCFGLLRAPETKPGEASWRAESSRRGRPTHPASGTGSELRPTWPGLHRAKWRRRTPGRTWPRAAASSRSQSR